MAVKEITEQNFKSEVLDNDSLTVVDFYATWCGPCRMLRPILEELSDEVSGAKFVSIDVDQASDIAGEFQIASIPCVVLIKGGKEVTRIIGVQPKDALKNQISKFI